MLKNLLVLLCVAGIAVSLYLTYTKLTASPILCKFGDCEKVQNSEYSSIFGVPVALFGVAFYFALFTTLYKELKKPAALLTLGGFGFSTYLTYLELYVIHAICMWCVISYVIIILIGLVQIYENFSRR
jgi:uncharacterized membrane protein